MILILIILTILILLLLLYAKIDTYKKTNIVIDVKQFLIVEIISIMLFLFLFICSNDYPIIIIISLITGIFTSIVLDKVILSNQLDRSSIKNMIYVILFLSIILFIISFYKINCYKNGKL